MSTPNARSGPDQDFQKLLCQDYLAACCALYLQYGPYVAFICWEMLGDVYWVQHAAQITFTRFLGACANGANVHQPKEYLCNIARSTCDEINGSRKQWAERSAPLESPHDGRVLQGGSIDDGERQAVRDALEACIQKVVPEPLRTCFRHSVLERRTLEEVSALTGISVLRIHESVQDILPKYRKCLVLGLDNKCSEAES